MAPPLDVLAVITARGGSKGIPGKNLAELNGKPLVAWTIEASLRARSVTRTVVSTDDEQIASVSLNYGAEAPFRRPSSLAMDMSPSMDAILHCLDWLQKANEYAPDVVVHLQPTSPLRTSSDIDAAMEIFNKKRADAVVSVSPVKQHPYWTKTIVDGYLHDFLSFPAVLARQSLPPVYALNGAIYLAERRFLQTHHNWYAGRTVAYVMPPERSVDVDTPFDMRVASMFLREVGTTR